MRVHIYDTPKVLNNYSSFAYANENMKDITNFFKKTYKLMWLLIQLADFN